MQYSEDLKPVNPRSARLKAVYRISYNNKYRTAEKLEP